MKRSHLKKGDVLLSIVGTVGALSLVKSEQEATCSCKLAILRPRTIKPSYLAIYLSSIIGKSLTERWKRGTVQTGLILDDMDQIPVVRWKGGLEKRINLLVDEAYSQLEESQKLFIGAEKEILKVLGPKDWQPNEPLTYTSEAKNVFEAQRIDAEYFNPAKLKVLETLSRMKNKTLDKRVKSIRSTFNPKKEHDKFRVRNFDLPDAMNPTLDDTKNTSQSTEIGSTKKIMKKGDVVISRLRYYLREISVVMTSPVTVTIGSTEFIVLRPRKSENVTPEVLWAFLRSTPVQTILKWCLDGSQHPRFSEMDLLNIPLPDKVINASTEIDSNFRKAIESRNRAHELLEKCKKAIEIAVEKSEMTALNYLEGS